MKNSVKMLSKLMLLMIAMISLVMFINYSYAAPFNLDIELPSTYHSVNPGQDVWFTIKLLNLANKDRMDVTLKFDLLDPSNKVVATKTKTVAVETQASFVADMIVPENTIPGDYYINVTMDSTLGAANTKTSLKVMPNKSNATIYYITAGILLLLILVFAAFKSKPLFRRLALRARIDRIVKERIRKGKN